MVSEEAYEVFTHHIELMVVPNILVQSIIQTAVDQHLKSSSLDQLSSSISRVRERIDLSMFFHRRSHVADQRSSWVSGTKQDHHWQGYGMLGS
jgi:hypothetical protein